MSVESDDDRLAVLDDFGVEVVVNGKTFIAILDNEWEDSNGMSVQVPVLTARTIDFENEDRGDTVSIGNTDYTIAEQRPDGQGITYVILQKT